MADLHSPRKTVTVQLPAAVLDELRQLSVAKGLSLDDIVLEACVAYIEPLLWEGDYHAWCAAHPTADSNGQALPDRQQQESA